MVKNNKWVALVAVLALIVAVVALVVILAGGMTGNAISPWSITPSTWPNNVQNLSFETIEEEINGTDRAILVLKIPVKYLTAEYRLHGIHMVNYIAPHNSSASSRSLTNWGGNNILRFNYCANNINSTTEFCELRIIRELAQSEFRVSSSDYIWNKKGVVVAAGFISTHYDSPFGWSHLRPDYITGRELIY